MRPLDLLPRAQFRYSHSLPLECVVCIRDISLWFEPKRDRAGIGFVPALLRQDGITGHTSVVNRGEQAWIVPELPSVLLNNLPDNFFADTIAPSRARLTNAPQHPSASDAGCKGPIIDDALYPIWDRHSSDVPSFADEVHDSPVFIATLEVTKVKFDEFAAT